MGSKAAETAIGVTHGFSCGQGVLASVLDGLSDWYDLTLAAPYGGLGNPAVA